jgi:GNAT superfamily N-acetyltransferase
MSKMQVAIRTAGAEDLEAVLELLLVQLHEHHTPISRERLRAGIEAWLSNPSRGLILVAQHDSRIVGVSCVDFMWPLEHGGLGGWLEELYVVPEYRKQGVGTQLLEATLSQCARLGCSAIDLEVEAGHARVESLYERFGFELLDSRRRWVKKLEST